MGNAVRLAWLTIVRQPARTCLAVLGVAAVGALLFDMLLLSRGLVLSFRDLLGRSGFDVRVLATDAPPFQGPSLSNSAETAAAIASLPEVDAVVRVRIRDVDLVSGANPQGGAPDRKLPDTGRGDGRGRVGFIGADPVWPAMWTLLEGRDLESAGPATAAILVNRNLAASFRTPIGSTLLLRGRCKGAAAIPSRAFTIAGIASFPFDAADAATIVGRLGDVGRLCSEAGEGDADVLLVRSRPSRGADEAAAAIRRVRPNLHVVTNEDLVERFSRVEFSYFRQISVVLATVTLFFGFLLIAVLLTVSVNQRLGEIAALRAVGLSRWRVVGGVLCESIILVGGGGLFAIPLGAGLSVWLDRILRALPDIPVDLQFFVFEPRALWLHAVLLSAAAVAAAAYPMKIVAVLPIAETLRREVVS